MKIEITRYWDKSAGFMGPDKTVEWFAHVHNGSGVDLKLEEEVLYLVNEAGERLRTDEEYESYEQLRMGLAGLLNYRNEEEWKNRVKVRCSSLTEPILRVMPAWNGMREDLLDLYFETKVFDLSASPVWYVGDIRWEGDGPETFCVSVEICAEPQEPMRPEKKRLEEKLAALYFDMETHFHPEIPFRSTQCTTCGNDRRAYVLKMLFALKGKVSWENVAYLDFLADRIKREKYSGIGNARPVYPNELMPDDVIKTPTYQFPTELTWTDIISAMGAFSTNEDDSERTIRICDGCINRTVRFLAREQAFQTDFVEAICVFEREWAREDSEAYDYDLYETRLQKLSELLRQAVIAHELGHLVFRKCRDAHSETESESLANWFACLLLDPFEQELLKALLPHQGPEYQDFIELPGAYRLEENEYQKYCDTMANLFLEW